MVSKPGYNPNTFVTGFSETEFEEIKIPPLSLFLIGPRKGSMLRVRPLSRSLVWEAYLLA